MKTGLANAINKYTFTLAFTLSINLYAQIPINGFCSYSVHNAPSGLSSLLSFNSNNDSYTDLLVYSSDNKAAYLLQAASNEEFINPRSISFRYPSSGIKSLSIGDSYSRFYLSLSRKNRKAQLLKSGDNGNFIILNDYTFSSYPQDSDVDDIDDDKSPEMVITGPAFNGITILAIKNGILKSYSVIENKAFKCGRFIDLNNDTYPDIAAVNLLDQKIDFFFNNSRGEYSFTRSFNLGSVPYFFNGVDLDMDTYNDLVWSEKGKIHVRFGDPTSSYRTEKIINTKFDARCIISGDFNKDGLKDIVYADTSAGVVSVIFSLEGKEFSGEMILFRKKNITDIVPYYSKFITGAAVLSRDGKIYTLANFSRIGEQVSITAGLNPGVVCTYNAEGNDLPDICFIDEEEMQIKFILRDPDGIPEEYFSYHINYPHKEILTYRYSGKTIFYLWTRGNNVIEIITADFAANKFSRELLYCSGKIHDMSIKPEKDNPASVYTAYIINGKAGANVFEYHDFRYIKSEYADFAPEAADITVYISAGRQGFYIWRGSDNLHLYFYDLKDINTPRQLTESISGEEIFSFSGNFNDNSQGQVSVIKSGRRSSLTVAGTKIYDINLPVSLSITDPHQLWSKSSETGGLTRIFTYLPGQKSLNLITLHNKGKNLTLAQKISGIYVNRYVIERMDLSGNHIVYSDPVEQCITIKRIK